MKRLLFQHNLDGLIKYICILFLFSLAVYNFSDQIYKNQNILLRSYLTIPFILLGVVGFFLNIKNYISVLLIIAGLYSLLNPGGSGDCSSAIWFILSLELNKNKTKLISVLSVTFLLLPFGYFNSSYSIFQTSAMAFGYVVIYSIYLKYVYNISTIKAKIKLLAEDENKLLQFMCAGYPQENAGKELDHKNKQETSKMMKVIREKLDIHEYESNYKVIYLYTIYGK